MVEPDGPQTAINIVHAHFACRITKATDIRSEYEILIALPRQQCLC